MIKLNLLPFRAARKKENVRRQVSVILLTLFLSVIIMVWSFIVLNKRINALDIKIKESKTELAKYNKKKKQLATIRRKLNTLKRKKGVIDRLELNRKEPVRLLDAMTQLIVARRMYFKSFSAKGKIVKVSGVALDNQTVADFMSRLQKSGLFRSVRLGPIRQTKVRKANLKTFQITCTKRSPKKKTAKKAKGKAKK